MGKILTFLTKNVETDVQLIPVKATDLLPAKKFVATLEEKDVEYQRICPDCGSRKGHIDQWRIGDQDVKERKQEFTWLEEDVETGERRKVSLQGSKTLNAVKEVPFSVLSKNFVPKPTSQSSGIIYLLKPWKGERNKASGSPKALARRKAQLYEEAVRFVKEGIAGIASFTWGNSLSPKSIRKAQQTLLRDNLPTATVKQRSRVDSTTSRGSVTA